MSDSNSIEYRNIEGFPGYRIGNDGSVWRAWVTCRSGRKLTNTWRLMKLAVTKRGYFSVNLTPEMGGKYTTFSVHRLMLQSFIGPCPDGMECRHLNGCKTDNRIENLAWGTPEQNRDDNKRLGRYSNTPRNNMYTHDGKTLSLAEWSRTLGVNYECLYQRIRLLKMDFEQAISKPFLGLKGNGQNKKSPSRNT